MESRTQQAAMQTVWLVTAMLVAAQSIHYANAAQRVINQQQAHTSNWAVLVATSKYWYNYRHIANTLSFYRTVKRLGIPDSNIILMLAEDVACNPRNAYPSQVFNDESHHLNVYGNNVEVDYRGYEVTVENFIRVLTGRHDPAVPRSKRMLSDKGSNVLIYISGHGGNEFMKFQDVEELMAQDVADAIQQMYEKGRYRELLLVVETCQAATLYSKINSPNVLAMASSLKGESSYSYLTDTDVGLSLIDRFTWQTLDFFEQVDIHGNMTLAQLMQIYRFEVLDSHFHFDASNYPHPLDQVAVTSYFGSVSSIQMTPELSHAGDELAETAETQQVQWQDLKDHEEVTDASPSTSFQHDAAAFEEDFADSVAKAVSAVFDLDPAGQPALMSSTAVGAGPPLLGSIAGPVVYLGVVAVASLMLLTSYAMHSCNKL